MQLAQKESQLAVADQQHVQFEQQIRALRAELGQQHAEVQSLQSQLEVAKEQEMAASVAADLDHILDDPDQLPAEAHQLMSSLRRDTPDSQRELPAKLQQLQKQLRRKEEEMKERDVAMQQLLRGADRIEEVQRATLAQLVDAQSEVSILSLPQLLMLHILQGDQAGHNLLPVCLSLCALTRVNANVWCTTPSVTACACMQACGIAVLPRFLLAASKVPVLLFLTAQTDLYYRRFCAVTMCNNYISVPLHICLSVCHSVQPWTWSSLPQLSGSPNSRLRSPCLSLSWLLVTSALTRPAAL